jgi:hypothetical protein
MKYPVKGLLGIVCHPWDMIGSQGMSADQYTRVTTNLQAAIIGAGFTGARLYADAWANKTADNQFYMFSPISNGNPIDLAIMDLKKAVPGFQILFAYQNMPKDYQAEWQALNLRSTIYRHPNDDPYKPETYGDLGKDIFVIASRGGTNPNVPDYPIYVSPNWWEIGQAMRKGAGLYDVIEGINEGDNNWTNTKFMDSGQYIAAWQTIYANAKKADPNIIVSSSGVMTDSPQILKDAIAWEKANGKKLFDEYQCHIYPWGWVDRRNGKRMDIANALPPEMNMIPAAKDLVAAAEGKPLIVGEWGFDIHPDSSIGIRPFGNYTVEQIRGYWIARSLLGFDMAGVKRSFYYREYQDYGLANDTNATIFETSSLFIKDSSDNIKRRFAGDVFKQLSQWPDLTFDSAVIDDGTKCVYKFVSGTKTVLVGWTIEQVQLVTINGTNRAQFTEVKQSYTFPAGMRYDLQEGSDSMTSQAFAGGSIELNTKPVFIVTGEVTPPPPPPPPTKEIYHRGYWTINSKRVYYINYKDGSWTLTNGRYEPI